MGIDVPGSWLAALNTAVQYRRLVVLGPNDAGKSTFCHWLADRMDAAMLDADIGQQSLGPPATVGLRAEGGVRSYFVGSTSPLAAGLPLLAGVAALSSRERRTPLVVNTSGLVAGPGLDVKLFKLDALRPDCVIAIQPDNSLEPLLACLRHLPILRLRPSALARRRSAARRRAVRQAAFARSLADATILDLSAAELVLQRTLPFAPSGRDDAGLLCGLAGPDGLCLGLGLLSEWRDGRLKLLTAVAAGCIRLVQFGRMMVAADGSEGGHLNMHQAPRRGRGA